MWSTTNCILMRLASSVRMLTTSSLQQETCRQFFHVFMDFGSMFLYNKYVVTPHRADDAGNHMYEMAMAWFAGCCGSSDASHVLIHRCCHTISQLHKGGKSKNTCRSLNLAVNHGRSILYSTKGYPAH